MFKVGDLIVFLKDIRAGSEFFVKDRKQIRIPKLQPCLISRINSTHVWVTYEKKEYMLRYIPNRMIYAGKAAKVLFGGN